MKNILAFLGLGIVLILSATVYSISQSADKMVDVYATAQSQPQGPAQRVIESRQKPPEATENRRASGAGMLAIAIVICGLIFAGLLFGERFLKQWRLLKKKKRGGAYQQRPMPQPGTPQTYLDAPDPIRGLGRPSSAGELPAWTETND